ncbi:MAG TPA: calcium/sodium antiporter [Phycisphaerae bacterium]|nr:calcium/sodium antiporter [Phycisphaerae bacterium]HRY70244.1 calcium/sodium antiporter [Phycisphaerae bacterium]HSA27585.1 calcium/sodium antiporter [Phycisphaerae bacterium]
MAFDALMVLGSLVLLYLGAAGLVRGSASLALRLGLTPLIVGLTVVAYGTSMPELVVSSKAALAHQGDIAVGNAVGSNTLNIGVILGMTALICPLRVQFQLVKVDTPVMIGASVLFLAMFRDAHISRPEAAVLFLGIVVYTIANIHLGRQHAAAEIRNAFDASVPGLSRHWAVDLFFILIGLLVLVVGSRLLVTGSVNLARAWGVSEAVIGLTIVAAGTSTPELATSIVAAWNKQADIALGNIVGSNTYNMLCIPGISGLLAPIDGAGISAFDLGVMLGTSAILLPILWTGFRLRRWEGAVLLLIYCGYVAVLWPK